MAYKIGDEVLIRSKEWFEAQDKNEMGGAKVNHFTMMSKDMTFYCGMHASIISAREIEGTEIKHFKIKIMDQVIPGNWSSEMFE